MKTLPEFSQQLRDLGVCQPTLVIDADALDHNIEKLNQVLKMGFDHRLVVKSLPCPGLIDYISQRTGSQRLMCFHAPFIVEMLKQFPERDILLGKPLSVSAAKFIAQKTCQPNSQETSLRQIQWLIDTPQRLHQYEEFARHHSLTLRINLEIDVGLHRGGFKRDPHYEEALKRIAASDLLEFSGLMGYEAHASKMPVFLGGMKTSLKRALAEYSEFKSLAETHLDTRSACFNSGGSTTFTHHHDAALVSELSVGSALLKPSDFDLPNLRHFQEAAFIATPIIKHIKGIDLPGPKAISNGLRLLGQLPPQAAYVYGGNWKAKPVFPPSAEQVALFGSSSNQELYGFNKQENIAVDDIMLFQPTQSEAVLLEFGELALVRNGAIEHWWPVLEQGDNPINVSAQST